MTASRRAVAKKTLARKGPSTHDPYTPPGAVPGFWYWCDYYRQYYPYVGVCPSGWRAVPAQ